MCVFWYDYVQPKYEEKAKLCYMDTDSFIVFIKTDNIYKDIAEDVETRFDRPLCKGKHKKVFGLMKDELGGKIIKEFVGLIAKTYSCLIDDDSKDKKAKGTKMFVIKKLKFEDYKNCLEATQLENRLNQMEKTKVNTENLTDNHNEFIKNSE